MQYKEMIRSVEDYSGLDEEESKDALGMMVESISIHLPEQEREEFASELPDPLQSMALSVDATEENSTQDILQQFMEIQDIDERTARTQITAAWQTIKEAISPGEIRDIMNWLPRSSMSILT